MAQVDSDRSQGSGTGRLGRRRPPRRGRGPVGALTGRQVNLLLGLSVSGAVTTGLVSWAVGTGWSRWWTLAHAVFGIAILVLTPSKMRGPVRTGFVRSRPTRWLSATFGILILAVIGLGLAHSSGLWSGVGYWSPLWAHFLLAFAAVPLLGWHLVSRPVRPRPADLDRRALLGAAATIGLAGTVVAATEGAVRLTGLAGAGRRFTGSHEVGSFDPDAMPTVSWIDDTAPDLDPKDWPLTVAGAAMTVEDLRLLAEPVVAALDCTGGWWSEQRWDAVPVSRLLAGGTDGPPRSFVVRSATGYTRTFPWRDAEQVHLAVGYDGRPLRKGHGAPVRLIAPGRRGPWWVKWVVSVEPSESWWLAQFPFPTT